MPKEINIEKIKKEFEKGDIPSQIKAYNSIGEWLHNQVQAHRDTLSQESEALKSLQEKLPTNKE